MNGRLAAILAAIGCPALLVAGAALRDPLTAWVSGLGHAGGVQRPAAGTAPAPQPAGDPEPPPVSADGFSVEALPPRVTATVGQTTTLLPRRLSGGVAPFTRRIEGGPGVTLTYSGAVLVSPTVPGTAGPYTLTVTDSQGRTSSSQMRVESFAPLALAGAAPGGATVGRPYQARFQARGGRPPYAWAFLGQEPEGTSFSNGLLSGTPSRTGTAGGLVVTVTDADNRQAYSGAFSVTVSEPMEMQQLPASLVTSVGAAETVGPRRVMGGSPPYVWSFAGPDGASMGPDGSVRVAPARAGSLGPYILTVRDSDGRTASSAMTVAAAERLEVAGVRDSSLPQGLEAHLTAPRAMGGTPPYAFSLVDGGGRTVPAPPGLTLSAATGAIEGVPSSAGTARYGLRVTDAAGRTASAGPFTVSVEPAAEATTGTPRDVTFDGSYRCTSRRSSDCHRLGNFDVFEVRFQSLVRVNDLSFGCTYGAAAPSGFWETFDGTRWARPEPAYSLPCSVVIPATAVRAVRFTRTSGSYDSTWAPTAQMNAYVQ